MTPSFPVRAALRALRPLRYPARLRSLILLALAGAAACTDSATLTEPPELVPFVGDWEAVSFELTELTEPGRTVELVQAGSTFTLNIQPSGTYTAILTSDRGASVEIGRLELEGTRVTFLRDYPSPSTSEGTLELLTAGLARLTGTTRYSFQVGAEPVEARMEIELRRD